MVKVSILRSNLPEHQRAVRAAHAGRVGKDGADGGIYGFGNDIEVTGFVYLVFQIDIGRHKTVLHHKNRIHRLAGARHPVLMTGHGFGGGDERPPI